jgi:uncharacterized protein
MDIVEQHFAAENAHDVPGILATYTDDIVWDNVPDPSGPCQGKDAVAPQYIAIHAAIPDSHFESVLRFSSGGHVIDEAIVTGHVQGNFLGVEGGGAPVRFRFLHVFDVRDGLISREQGWWDTAGIIRQIEAHAAATS